VSSRSRPAATCLAYGGDVASSRRLRALITNDDGIDSPGLRALATGARDAGFDVVVAAPHVDASGVGGSVLAVRDGRRVRVHSRELPDLPGIPAFAVEGHPAFIVHSAGRGWLDPEPDVVLSGINIGANLGHAVLHSGTIGAALAASLHGWRGLAVSLGTPLIEPERPHWESALKVLPDVLDVLLAAPDGTVLSLNVPDLPVAELGALGFGPGTRRPPRWRQRRPAAHARRRAGRGARAGHRHGTAGRRPPDPDGAAVGHRPARAALRRFPAQASELTRQ
jgi:5'-nucleotidase